MSKKYDELSETISDLHTLTQAEIEKLSCELKRESTTPERKSKIRAIFSQILDVVDCIGVEKGEL